MKQIEPYFPAERLIAYQVAREVLVEVERLSRTWIGWAELGDQARRASLSVLLNVGEGASQVSRGAKRRHYAIALASAGELAGALDGAVALGLAGRALRQRVLRLGALV